MFSLVKAKSSKYSYKVNHILHTGHADSYAIKEKHVKVMV